uniref:Uncharacterized protein n=1 Tax=Arundo donax TaxID=35708 RepID=A0A0A9GCJ4_ARUDO
MAPSAIAAPPLRRRPRLPQPDPVDHHRVIGPVVRNHAPESPSPPSSSAVMPSRPPPSPPSFSARIPSTTTTSWNRRCAAPASSAVTPSPPSSSARIPSTTTASRNRHLRRPRILRRRPRLPQPGSRRPQSSPGIGGCAALASFNLASPPL